MAPLLLERERRAFLDLEGDGQRERFIRAFWAARPAGQLERWQANRRAALQLRERAPAMERAVFLAGKPVERRTVDPCETSLRRIEFWTYDRSRLELQLGRPPSPDVDELVLAFVQEVNFDPRSMRLWSPNAPQPLGFADDDSDAAAESASVDPGRVFERAERRRCLTAAERQRLERRLALAVGWPAIIDRLGWSGSSTDWLEDFTRVEAVLDPNEMAASGAELTFEALGGGNRRTAMRGRLRLPIRHLAALGAGQILDRVTLTGDIYYGSRFVDSFVVTHHIGGGSQVATDVTLDFFRRLPPGRYRLELRAADRAGSGLLRTSRSLDVPPLTTAPEVPGLALESRRETIVLTQLPSVELLAPEGPVLGSAFTARVVASPDIARVDFLRDDTVAATATEAPFVADIELPRRRHRIEVRGLDRDGVVLARHGLSIERAERPFAIRLERPDPDELEEELTLDVEVDVPSGSELELVQCFLGAEPFARMTSPPFRCEISPGKRRPLSFVRAAAALRSGEQVEDLAFLGLRGAEQVEVRLVELLVSVSGGAAPAADLSIGDFVIRHRGRQEPVRDFRRLAERPLNVALLMDVSSSLGRGVRVAVASAERFFLDILTERDAASLMTFNHDLERLVPFTNDRDELRYAAEGLRAWGATRLYDGIAYAASSFAGRPDRRALVVLSDGADTDSSLDFDRVLGQLERANVVVYPIALRVSDETTVDALRRLAAATGGEYHAANALDDLDRIYERIARALRSQYLLAFEPSADRGDGSGSGLRDIQVGVLRPGLSATGVRSRPR